MEQRKEYLELQSVLKQGSQITNVEYRNNRLYFAVDGHEFYTYADCVIHKNNPLFNHPVGDFLARKHNTTEGIEEVERRNMEIDKQFELFAKHKTSLYKIVFLRALEIMVEKGDEAFVEYIDHHFEIMEEGDNCQPLIQILQNKENKNQ
jgi:hypothetical protein